MLMEDALTKVLSVMDITPVAMDQTVLVYIEDT